MFPPVLWRPGRRGGKLAKSDARRFAITDPEPGFRFTTRHWVLAGAALALLLLGLCA